MIQCGAAPCLLVVIWRFRREEWRTLPLTSAS
jgi:hypothetical protein